jgi:alkylated DNA nucleotide flippase Atl1
MKKTKKKLVKKPRLSEKLVKVLKNMKGTITYGKLADKYGTNARAVGQAVKALSKEYPKLANHVVYDPNTRIKNYKTKK